MLSKAQSKYIRSLEMQKFRQEHRTYLAEGDKIAREWLASSARIQMIVALAPWAAQHQDLIRKHPEAELVLAEEEQLKQVSGLQTPNQVILVVALPEPEKDTLPASWALALDAIRDPGNMGTLLRIADWFGIDTVTCSPDCTDVFAPKVVQSAMGAHLRVRVLEQDLPSFIRDSKLPAVAATLEGTNVYGFRAPAKGILVIGNESRGVSEAVKAACTQQVSIPRTGGAESLNAAVSAGILCALLLPRP